MVIVRGTQFEAMGCVEGYRERKECRPMAEQRACERRKADRRRGGDRRSRAVHVAAEALLRKLIEDLEVACNTRQVDKVAGLYATDAVVLPPNGMPVRGRAYLAVFCGADQSGTGGSCTATNPDRARRQSSLCIRPLSNTGSSRTCSEKRRARQCRTDLPLSTRRRVESGARY
jgi:hypothetical protein